MNAVVGTGGNLVGFARTDDFARQRSRVQRARRRRLVELIDPVRKAQFVPALVGVAGLAAFILSIVLIVWGWRVMRLQRGKMEEIEPESLPV